MSGRRDRIHAGTGQYADGHRLVGRLTPTKVSQNRTSLAEPLIDKRVRPSPFPSPNSRLHRDGSGGVGRPLQFSLPR